MKCKNCGRDLEDNAKFCKFCGYRVPKKNNGQVICKSCGKILDSNEKFCKFCGNKIDNNIYDFDEEDNNSLLRNYEYDENNNPKSIRNKIIIAVMIAAILLMAAVSTVLLFKSGALDGLFEKNINNEDNIRNEETTETENKNGNRWKILAHKSDERTASDIVEQTSEATTERITLETTESYDYEEESKEDVEESINRLMTGLFSDGFPNSVNMRDASYLTPYTVIGSPIYNDFSTNYWKLYSDVTFNYITDVGVYNIIKNDDDGYNVWVYYTYSLNNNGKVSVYTELAVENVVKTDEGYKAVSHTYKATKDVGEAITAEDYQ